MEGWIKLHRGIFTWEWYDDASVFRLFIHLLLKANSKDAKWRGIIINRGQCFTSIAILAKELNMTDKQVRIAMAKLIKTKEVASKGANNGTMLTICNYDTYQGEAKAEGRTKRQTKGDKQEEEEVIISKDIITLNESCKKYFDKKYINNSSLKMFDGLVTKGYTIRQIKQAILNAKNDDFWSKQFLSPMKLIAKDKEKVVYIDKFLNLNKTTNETTSNIYD